MDDLLAGRAQMGISLAFHIVFASLGVGLPALMAMAHFVALKKRDEVWMRLTERIARAFTVLVVIGVISGIVISVELALLWPDFMERAGPVIGVPISLETYAFFFEAIFLALYLFGRDRLSPWAHWACLIPVCLGGMLSAFIIVSVNAWMNTPVGFDYVDGEFRNPDIVEAVFNPSMPGEVLHMIAAAYVATGFACAAVFGVAMLRGRRGRYERNGLALGMTLVAFWILPLGVGGDLAGRLLHENQPAKLAAMEGLMETEKGAGLTIGGIWVDGENKFGIEIPYGLSLLVGRDPDTVVKGLEEFPPDERPPVAPVRYAFTVMIGVGTLISVGFLAYWFARWRRPRWLESRWLPRLLVACGPASFVAIEAGWIVTEMGRQPWIIYGYRRVSESLTTSTLVDVMLFVFTGLYVLLSVVCVVALRSEMRLTPRGAGPKAAH
ncbi:MAG TPA: cytochrome ubiquinol oxidase subunit I [Solirubrobacteraceae bacterium]|nr:cytochrome ubiquinol oxidase subunit I [Solirubrobacteraceae bacterium]